MTSKVENTQYLLSIAQKFMQDSCSKEVYNKYYEIKQSISLKNSILKTQKKIQKFLKKNYETNSHSKSKKKNQKFKDRQKRNLSLTQKKRSNSQIKIQSDKKINQKRANRTFSQASIKKPLIIKEQSDFNKKPILKKSILYSPKSKSKEIIGINNKQSSRLRQNIDFNNKTTIRKNSQLNFKKEPQNYTNNKNLQNCESTNNFTKKTYPQFVNSKLISKKLFGQEQDKQNTTFPQNQIIFNLNLHKILTKVQKIMQQQKYKHQIMSKNIKKSMISQQNLNLLKNILTGMNGQPSNQISQLFKSNKSTHLQFNNLKDNKNKIEESSKQKQQMVKKEKYMASKNQKAEQNQSFSQQKESKQILSTGRDFKQKQKTYKNKIKQMKKDNKWLVETMQKLLNQNEQLKNLLAK